MEAGVRLAVGLVVSHPCAKKEGARMGHGAVVQSGHKAMARTTADPSTPLRLRSGSLRKTASEERRSRLDADGEGLGAGFVGVGSAAAAPAFEAALSRLMRPVYQYPMTNRTRKGDVK